MTEAGPSETYYDDLLRQRVQPKWDRFSWVTLRALFSSANDIIARGAGSFVNDRRQRWVAQQQGAGVLDEFPDLIVDLSEKCPRSFLIIGDPGEADESQYAVVKPLLGVAKGTAFMIVMSDVIYPSGNVNDYVNGFYVPYAGYRKPIYAIPGNHDWYDGLEGFMFHFCGAEPLPGVDVDPASFRPRERVWRRIWRRAASPNRALLHRYRSQRPPWHRAPSARHQPGPYFALDLGRLLVVCIDAGVTGELDAAQGAWLRRVSARTDRQKLLVTGKPLYVDNERKPGLIADWFRTSEEASKEPHRFVDEIVRDPTHRYIGAIGGDIHNYQRYTVLDARRRELPYLVSGGAGAYLGETHQIKVRAPGEGTKIKPDRHAADRTYPSAAESLDAYARTMVPAIWKSMRVLCALAIGLLVGAVIVVLERTDRFGYGYATELAAVAAGLVMAGVLLFVWRAPRRKDSAHAGRRFRGFLVAAVAAGAEIVLLARIASGGHAWESFDGMGNVVGTAAAALVVLALLVFAWHRARDPRKGEYRRPGWWLRGLACAFAGSAGLALVWNEADWQTALQVLFGICIVLGIPVAALLVDRRVGRLGYPSPEATERAVIEGPAELPRRPVYWAPDPARRWARRLRRRRGPLLALFAVALVVSVALLWWWDKRAGIALLVTVAALLQVPIGLVFIYELGRSSPNAALWIVASYGLAAAALGLVFYALDAAWVARYLAAVACVVATAVVLVLFLYLYWIRGFALLRHAEARNGVLADRDGSSLENARAFLLWHADPKKCARPSPRVTLIGQIVLPSRGNVRSPVHNFLSEIFVPDAPRLYKSFLRITVFEHEVRVRCFGVTGASAVATDVETVVMPLAPVS